MITSLLEKIYAANPSADQINEATPIDLDKNADLNIVVAKVLNWMWWFGGVIIFIYLLISGITYITAGGNAEQAKKGMQGLINCIIAIIIFVLSLALIRAVDQIGHSVP